MGIEEGEGAIDDRVGDREEGDDNNSKLDGFDEGGGPGQRRDGAGC